MSSLPPSSTDDLQFNTIEPAGSGGPAQPQTFCAACRQPILSTYYAVGNKMICPSCKLQVNAPMKGSKIARVLKATLGGIFAGLLGAAIWYAIRHFGHIEVGLVAVLVGYMVGKSVRHGSGGRGGLGYQILAVVITYACISANYMPDVFSMLVKEHNRRHPDETIVLPGSKAAAPAAVERPTTSSSTPASPRPTLWHAAMGVGLIVGVVFVMSLTIPFLGGASNVIGILIIGFALWEAWKFNRKRELNITGPYSIGPSSPVIYGGM